MTTSADRSYTASRLQSNSTPHKVVANYVLQSKLGSGSFAHVFKGVHQHDGNVVAIKAIERDSSKLTPKVLQNLEIEIAILRTYRHANIVVLTEVHKTERHFYLVLEYCAGGDVQHLIRSRLHGRLSEGLARRLMRDLAAGLQFLWQQQLIHRDIKPQNLLLTGPLPLDEVNDPEKTPQLEQMRLTANFPTTQFCCKIADFGFARHLQSTSLAETLCGSPLYMAPEILQHHRYDAKADLWSVGTVLFEMISGSPPFHGENHLDLLRNIQRKAVRLPPNVKVSKECVNLLRLLLNRNPLSRVGFNEFFLACEAFVALGCNGVLQQQHPTQSPTMGQQQRLSMDLGTIQEDDHHGASGPPVQESLMTVTTTAAAGLNKIPPSPQLRSLPTAMPAPLRSEMAHPLQQTPPTQQLVKFTTPFEPLVPSPPNHPTGPFHAAAAAGLTLPPAIMELQSMGSAPNNRALPPPPSADSPTRRPGSGNSSAENSFVMVEHGGSGGGGGGNSSVHKQGQHYIAPSTGTGVVSFSVGTSGGGSSSSSRPPERVRGVASSAPPSSPRTIHHTATSLRSPGSGDYVMTKGGGGGRGMLSTSPGTGGALMGMLSGRAARLVYEGATGSSNNVKQIDETLALSAKMLATAEDIGRRAISVAHLGDNRAYVAMKLVMMSKGGSSSSSLLSTTPMEGIEEEDANEENDSGEVTDDSSSTEIMAARRRRCSSSTTDKSMPDMLKPQQPVVEDEEEMPFAIASEAQPSVMAAGIMPSRSTSSAYDATTRFLGMGSGASITSAAAMRASLKPTPANIRSHFSEALSCYLKALKMLKGGIDATQRVKTELESLTSTRGCSNEHRAHLDKVQQRLYVTMQWLSGQFKGVMDRAEASNSEVGKFSTSDVEAATTSSSSFATSVEELIYNYALAYGREGAVKQLLGQYEAARGCYRSAGLLAETLLMESSLTLDDRKVLEGYVDGFATRITELDQVMLQQSRNSGGGSTSVVGLVSSPAMAGLPLTSSPRGHRPYM